MRVTDTDLPVVVEPAEEQNKRDLPIMAGGGSQNTRPFGGGGLIRVSRVTSSDGGEGVKRCLHVTVLHFWCIENYNKLKCVQCGNYRIADLFYCTRICMEQF